MVWSELYQQQPLWAVFVLFLIGVWTLVWEGLALWQSARHQQKKWFIVMFVVNTLGLLPIIYLLWFRPRQTQRGERKVSVRAVEKKKLKEIKRT